MTDGLNNKNQQLIDLLTATNSKLDSVISLLGGVPPSTEHTIDDLWTELHEINISTAATRTYVYTIMSDITPATGDTNPYFPVKTALSKLLTSTGTPQFADDNILAWLSGIGIVTGDATTTILGRLTAIENQTACLCAGDGPSPTDPLTCAEPLVTIAQQNGTGSYSEFSFVIWPATLPTGIIFTTDLSIGITNTEISASPPHVGARIYGASKSAAVFQASPGNVTQYPTNEWVVISIDSWTLAPCVPVGNDLKVYLCDDLPPFIDCVTRASELMTVTYPPGTTPATHTRYYTPLAGLGLDLTDSVTVGGATTTTDVADSGCTNDMIGVTVTLISGPFCRVVWIKLDGSFGVVSLTTIGQVATVIDHTTYFNIDNWQSNDVSPGIEYTVELCPPTPA